MTDAAASTLNDRLAGRYVVEREIGAGGMAVVYLAHDVRHDRPVALKVLRAELAAVIGAERFLAEIRTTARLQHPGILPLFDSGEVGGQLFYVMPFVEGESLRERFEREGQLPVAEALRIASEIADALAYAHEQQVIHRDIKPENVLLRSGHALVMDFGIALAVQQAGGNRLTQTGLSLGTPRYMSPEQAAGEQRVDGRADQYALAVVLYELLAGETPFTAPTTQALIAKVMTETPALLSRIRKSVPESVSDAVARALEKLPADRFPAMRDFAAALAGQRRPSINRAPDVSQPVPRVSGRRWSMIAAVALGAGLLAGAAVDRLARGGSAGSAAATGTFTIEPDSGQTLAIFCCGNLFALSPNGRRVVFQAFDRDSIVRLHVRELEALETRPVPGTEQAHDIAFSPDGQQLSFLAGRTLKVVDLASGRVRAVTDLPPSGFTGGTAWTSDARIAYAVGNALYAVPIGGGRSTALTVLDASKHEFQLGGPHVVAGTDLILYSVYRAMGEPIIRALWLSTGKTRDIALGVAPAVVTRAAQLAAGVRPELFHDDVLLCVRSNGVVEARGFRISSGDTAGPAVRIADHVSLRSPVFLYANFAASASGSILVVRASAFNSALQGTLHVVTAGVNETQTPSVRSRIIHGPRFSPDGRTVVALEEEADTARTVPFLYNLQRHTTTLLPAAAADLAAVEWVGADSILSVDTESDLYIQSTSGDVHRKLGTIRGWGRILQLSLHGAYVVFAGERAGSFDIGIAHRDSLASPRVVIGTPVQEQMPQISPDGHYIAFNVARDGPGAIHVATFPSLHDEIVLVEGVVDEPRWARDGTLYYPGPNRTILAATLRPGGPPVIGSRRSLNARLVGVSFGWDIDPATQRVIYGSDAGGSGVPRLVLIQNGIRVH